MIKSLIFTSLAFVTLGFGYGADTLAAPDLCAELTANGYPVNCSPTGPDAPWWADDVCCDAASCVEQGSLGCPDNTVNYWCRYAEIDTEGHVTCLFEVPNYCDEHDCSEPPGGFQPQPQSNVMCCYAEGCYDPKGDFCGGILYWCDDGVTNLGGTVTCFD